MKKIILLAGLIIGSLALGWGIKEYRGTQRETGAVEILAVESLPTPTPKLFEQVSPDGKMMVSVKIRGEQAEIWVQDLLVMIKRLESDEELLIPFNTWSPDNKYFFVESRRGGKSEYWVMKATGELFAEGGLYLTVVEPFTKEYPGVTLLSVTGWASPTLLIINARSEAESKMSFWYEVPSRHFIRLSSYFY